MRHREGEMWPVNKWNIGFYTGPDYMKHKAVRFYIFCFKLKDNPERKEGEACKMVGFKWTFAIYFKIYFYIYK